MAFGYYDLNDEQEVNTEGFVPIVVMANFRKDGKFIPVKAQIIENEEKITIDLIVRRTIESKDRIVFDCYYERSNYKYPIIIFYFFKRHIWMMKKRHKS